MIEKKEAYRIIDSILEQCSYYTMIRLQHNSEGITRYSRSKLQQNICKEDMQITMIMSCGKKRVSVTTNGTDKDSIIEAVRTAERNLLFMPDRNSKKEELTEPIEIYDDSYDEEFASKYEAPGRVEIIGKCLNMLGTGYDAAGSCTLEKEVLVIGNSRGIRRYSRKAHASFNASVTGTFGNSGYAQVLSDGTSSFDCIGAFNKACDKASSSGAPVELEPGRYTVILESLAVGNLLGNMALLIAEGVVKEFAYDRDSAMQWGLISTGHATDYLGDGGVPENMVIKNGNSSVEQLVSETQKGILVTRLYYINTVNASEGVFTGLTRDGTFLIENGKIVCPIRNMRFTDSILNILNSVSGVSAERELVPAADGYAFAPALRIEAMNFSGNSNES